MSDVLEVVKIARPECPGGFVEINKTDLKPGDILFEVASGAISDETKGLKSGKPEKTLHGPFPRRR